MCALLLSSLFSLFLFVSFGCWVCKVLKLDAAFSVKMLIGLVTVNAITTIITLFLPVTIYVLLALTLLAAVLLPFIKSDISSLAGVLTGKQNQLIISFLFIFPAILIPLNHPDNYDTGLYHTQAIKWIEEYPVVPGLANLHGRFGFNPNVFSLFALTSLSAIFGQNIYSINFTAFIIIIPWFINTIYGLFKKQGITGLLLFLLVIFFTVLQLTRNLTSPSPDFLSLVLTLFVFAQVAALVAQDKPLTAANYLPIVILSAYIITVKLSVLPVLLLPLLLLFTCKLSTRTIWLLIGIPIVIITPWLVRNVITSGWLIYPLPQMDLFSFDWKVPLEKVTAEQVSVTGWARNPGPRYAAAAHMPITGWFPLWWQHFKWYDHVFIITGLTMPILALGMQLIKRKAGYLVNCIIVTALAGGFFWLFTAPVFRFGIAFITVGLITPLLVIKFTVKPAYKPLLVLSLLMVLSFCMEVVTAKFLLKNAVFQFCRSLIKPRVLSMPADGWYKVHTTSGTNVYEPLPGDQCFGHTLPCTPYPDTLMVMRGKDLAAGFKIKPR